MAGRGGGVATDSEKGNRGEGMRRPRPSTPEGSVSGGVNGTGHRVGAEGDEEWHIVGRRGRRVPSPAEGDTQVRVMKNSWESPFHSWM